MIVAVVVLEQSSSKIKNNEPPFVPLKDEVALEHLARIVLRGPFGVTVVASATEYFTRAKEVLSGFALQHVKLKSNTCGITEAVGAAISFRERWQKLMSDAATRFGSEDDDDEEPAKKSKGKGAKADWTRHRASPDVKVRGLARSFDRDGIIIFPANRPAISPELQAQMVEAFGREGADKGGAARPIAQSVYQGQRGYPVIIDMSIAAEVAALPLDTNFDDWLMKNLSRIQDVNVQHAGAVAVLKNEQDYDDLCALLKIDP
jgi:hypothetical protein